VKRSGIAVLARLARLEERKRQRALGVARQAVATGEERQRALALEIQAATLPAALRSGAASAAQLRAAGDRGELLQTRAARAASDVSRLRQELDAARASLAQATLRARALRDVEARRRKEQARERRRSEARRADARVAWPASSGEGENDAH
jgi:flagellar export protein FliJ